MWLRAQTLRAEVHLVENQDFLGSASDFADYSRFYSLFRSSFSLTFLAIITVITMTVITLAIIVLANRRRSLSSSSSCHMDDSGPSESRDSCHQLRQTTDDVLKRPAGPFLRPDVHLEEKKCTCDDEFCDEQLLSSGQEFTNPYQGRDYGWEGPPDIILYFPYNATLADTSAPTSSSYALTHESLLDKNYPQTPFGMLSQVFPPFPA